MCRILKKDRTPRTVVVIPLPMWVETDYETAKKAQTSILNDLHTRARSRLPPLNTLAVSVLLPRNGFESMKGR